MTNRVLESEQGQLQGAAASVGSVAGVFSLLFFGAVYSVSVCKSAWVQLPGRVFLLASGALGSAGLIGRRSGQRAAARV
jgi:MFS transporter, DHA1 family, tetracycline resistance protein